jgi:hypothetical protein
MVINGFINESVKRIGMVEIIEDQKLQKRLKMSGIDYNRLLAFINVF